MSSGSKKHYKTGKDKLNNVSKQELDALKEMEKGFNQSLSSYSQKYKSFMENYYSAVESVEKCKAECLNKYKSDLLRLGVIIKQLVRRL